jgi:hypothetical protein
MRHPWRGVEGLCPNSTSGMFPQMAAISPSRWLLSAPPPVGYDPIPTFHSIDHLDYGVLKLMTWRVILADTPATNRAWIRSPE